MLIDQTIFWDGLIRNKNEEDGEKVLRSILEKESAALC